MSILLLILAFVLFLIAGLVSVSSLSGVNPHTLLYFGLAAWVLAELVGGAGPYLAKWRSE